LIYIILGAMFIKLLKKTVKDGPMNAASTGY